MFTKHVFDSFCNLIIRLWKWRETNLKTDQNKLELLIIIISKKKKKCILKMQVSGTLKQIDGRRYIVSKRDKDL